MAVPGISLVAVLQGISSVAALMVMPSSQVRAVQREGFLAQ